MIDKSNIFSKEIIISDILDYTILAVKRCFREIFFFTLIFYLPLVIVLMFINYFIISGMLKFIIFSSVLILYYLFMNPFYKAILIKVIYSKITGEKSLNWNQMLKNILTKTPRLLIGNFIRFILIMVFISIVLVISIFYSGILSVLSALSTTALLIKAGTITSLSFIVIFVIVISGIFIPYGLFMYPYFRFGYIMHFTVLEGASSMYAFRRSINITISGYFKAVFSYLFIFIMFLSVSFVVIAIPAIIMGYFGFENIRSIIEQLSMITGIICYPVFITLSTVLYAAQRRKNDGFDLLIRTKELLFKKKNELEMVNEDGEKLS